MSISNLRIKMLIKKLSEEFKKDYELMSMLNLNEKKFVSNLHLGYGMDIRNEYMLWGKNEITNSFNEIGIYHADDMSSIIICSLYRTLKEVEIDILSQVKKYRDHWEKYDPDINKGILK